MTEQENVHEVWSEQELDTALAGLHAGVPAPDLGATRAELMAAAGARPSTQDVGSRRHWLRWAVSAAAVLLIVAGVLIVQTVSIGDHPPAASAAAAGLNSAADKVGARDPAVAPGQYRYLAAHSWNLATIALAGKDGNTADAGLSYLQEQLSETWIPADPDQEWLLRTGDTDNRKWLVGSEAKAKEEGIELPPGRHEEMRAPRGEFYGRNEPSWQTPTPEFLAALPTDPKKLYDKLRADTAGRGQDPDLEMLVYVADVLRGGTVPAAVRANLYRTLAMVPGLEITDGAANLDGKVGVAYGMNRAGGRQEVIIDAATGQFIGEREVNTRALPGLPAGTVTSYSSVTSAVVDAIGVAPR
jgi:hypothetical protein